MNTETPQDTDTFCAELAAVIRAKSWYVFDQNGGFLWEQSVEKLAQLCKEAMGWGEATILKQALENSITPDALVAVETEEGNTPLISQLVSTFPQVPMVVLTEGEPQWQRTKVAKTKLELALEGRKLYYSADDKSLQIVSIITEQLGAKKQDVFHVCIVDDKQLKLEAATAQVSAAFPNAIVHTYLFVGETEKSEQGGGLIPFLEQKVANAEQLQQPMLLILDMDGVLIDTDVALQYRAPQLVYESMSK